jgi:hypothetical protein
LKPDGDGQGSPAPLHIASVELGSAEFQTDRGRAELPAWLFSFDEVAHPAPVLALDSSEMFEHPGPSPHLPARYGARAGPDDLTIAVTFVGGNPRFMSYAADAVEAPHAIAIQIHQLPADPSLDISPSRITTAVGYSHVITTRLNEPVGDRVLIDPYTWAPAPFASD